MTLYCSRECQKVDWQEMHKVLCNYMSQADGGKSNLNQIFDR